jgi:hypothetical protein
MATPENIVELVKSYIGDSLTHNKDDLALLTARQVDDPDKIVQIKTNCGMFALGIWWAAGVKHELLNTKYKSGMAIAWVRRIAIEKNALRTYPKNGPPVAGSLLHYFTPGKNDSHVEFCLSNPDKNMVAEHGGGGRPDNAITSGISDIKTNYYRRLQEWVDPVALLVGSPEFSWNNPK